MQPSFAVDHDISSSDGSETSSDDDGEMLDTPGVQGLPLTKQVNYCSINIEEHAKRGVDSPEDQPGDFEEISRGPFEAMVVDEAKDVEEDFSTPKMKYTPSYKGKVKEINPTRLAKDMVEKGIH